ncbi:putative Ig domain-containing protein [Jatrophihabitans sp.]|uniref:putative Ig domain-containing protein n=1 Tax=Jatrophihabitans sp. TaxID=1932789 RepID=UPI0030C707CC|nr:Transglutaminase-activating metalloprotease [Jatrophihabitans sp.]
MNVAQRGLTVLVGGTALAMTLSTTALATPASTSTGIKVVNSCSQNVAAGHYTCYAMRRTDLGFKATAQVDAQPQATPSGFGPSSLQSAYALPSSTAGSGKRIYIVDAYDDPNAESDLAAYRSQYGLAACTTANGCFQKLNQNGATSPLPTGDTGWAGEISLDLDMASAVCPNCGITLIEANDASDNLFTAVKEATTLGAKYVSMSWGGPEGGTESSYDSTYFKSSGVVYTASTGDGAYSAGVIYPATSPDVVAVGGTALKTASNTRGWTESVWKTSSTEGGGSGCSSDEAKPSWQSIISTSTCSKRADSDVSAVADPATGVAVYQTYGGSGWAVYGGTSAAAPIIAATYALAGTPASTDKPPSFPYSHTANLNDVTSGNNGTCSPSLLCTAATGWDGPTGLGTPNGVAAFTSGGGGGTGNTVTVTNPGSKTGTVGTATSLQISGTDSAGAALTYTASGLPTGLSISSSGLISGTPSAAGTFSVTVTAKDSTGASGSTTFSWVISTSGGGGGSCSGQKLLNPGFESGATSWTASSGVINTDGAHSHAGSGYAWLDGYGSTHTDTLSQAVTIPAGCSASLTYYLYISSSEGTSTAYDKLSVTANGTAVQSFSNVNKGSGYVQRTVSLSAYAGKSVTIKWTGTEDSSVATSFFIDDTALTLS